MMSANRLKYLIAGMFVMLLFAGGTAQAGISRSDSILSARYDSYRNYRNNKDTLNMRLSFESLKQYSLHAKKYEYYFRAWSSMLSFALARGESEFVLQEVNRMEYEANTLDYAPGRAVALAGRADVYAMIGQLDKAQKLYNEALATNLLTMYDQLDAYWSLVNLNIKRGKLDEALDFARKEQIYLDSYLSKYPECENNFAEKRLRTELDFCEIYLIKDDKKNLKIHIDKAARLDSPDFMFSLREKLHGISGGYYALIGDWDNSIKEYDIALSTIGITQPFYYFSVLLRKGDTMQKAGLYRQAAMEYRLAVQKLDSLNRDVLKKHEALYRNNYKVRSELMKNEAVNGHINMVILFTGAIIAVLLFLLIIYSIYLNNKLKVAEHATKKAHDTVKSADKMKEIFLHNIVREIRIPLNAVMGFSEQLSTQADLDADEKRVYVSIVKTNAAKLTRLIFDILNLSRLESGMYKFEVMENDLVALCRDAKMMAEMESGNNTEILFHTNLTELKVHIDSTRFLKTMRSLLEPEIGMQSTGTTEFWLDANDKLFVIKVTGSPLLQNEHELEESDMKESYGIQHKINSLFLEHFNGTYRIDGNVIYITYPIL